MTDEKKKRTKGEILADLKRELELDGVEEDLEGKSDEEIMDLFERDGGDRKEMEAFLAGQERELRKVIGPATAPEPEPAQVIDLATYRRRVVRWAAGSGLGGIAIAAAVAAIYIQSLPTTPTNPILGTAGASPPDDAGPDARSPREEATKRRSDAYAAYVDGDYAACVTYLDEAKQKDPVGDVTATAQHARARCEAALTEQRRDH
jgi:hypothetical protein